MSGETGAICCHCLSPMNWETRDVRNLLSCENVRLVFVEKTLMCSAVCEGYHDGFSGRVLNVLVPLPGVMRHMAFGTGPSG